MTQWWDQYCDYIFGGNPMSVLANIQQMDIETPRFFFQHLTYTPLGRMTVGVWEIKAMSSKQCILDRKGSHQSVREGLWETQRGWFPFIQTNAQSGSTKLWCAWINQCKKEVLISIAQHYGVVDGNRAQCRGRQGIWINASHTQTHTLQVFVMKERKVSPCKWCKMLPAGTRA